MRSGVTSSTGWPSWVGRNPALWCPEREVGKAPPLAPQLNHATAPHAFPNRGNHVAPHTEPDDAVLPGQRHRRNVRGNSQSRGKPVQLRCRCSVRGVPSVDTPGLQVTPRAHYRAKVRDASGIPSVHAGKGELRKETVVSGRGSHVVVAQIRAVQKPVSAAHNLLVERVRERHGKILTKRRRHPPKASAVCALVKIGSL